MGIFSKGFFSSLSLGATSALRLLEASAKGILGAATFIVTFHLSSLSSRGSAGEGGRPLGGSAFPLNLPVRWLFIRPLPRGRAYADEADAPVPVGWRNI